MDGNRYFLMMFDHTEVKLFRNYREYKSFLVNYSSNNKDSKNMYVYGDFSVLNKDTHLIKYTVYKKITQSYDLERIDGYLSKVENQNELKERFKVDVAGGNGKMHIGYMQNGQARTLPIFYKKDKVYTDYELLKELILSKVLEQAFLSKIWTNRKINQTEYRKKVSTHLEKIQIEYGKYVINKMTDSSGIKSAVSDFIKVWCTKDGEINQRYVRELGSIVKNIINAKENTEEIKEVKEAEKNLKEIEIKGKNNTDSESKPKTRRRTKNNHENMDPLF